MELTEKQKDLVKRFCNVMTEFEKEMSDSDDFDEAIGEAVGMSRADMRDIVWHIEQAMKEN